MWRSGSQDGLDFNPKKPKRVVKSQKRFAKWLEQKQAMGTASTEAYRDVMKRRSTEWAQAAAFRMGLISENFAETLLEAEVPRVARTGRYAKDLTEAYCGALADKADPLSAQAVAGYRFCIERGTSSRWTRACYSALTRLLPEDFPPSQEVHGPSNALAPVLSTAKLAER